MIDLAYENYTWLSSQVTMCVKSDIDDHMIKITMWEPKGMWIDERNSLIGLIQMHLDW